MFNSSDRFKKDWGKLWNKIESNDGEMDLPDSYDCVPTLRCNLKCKGCFQDKCRYKRQEEFTLGEFRKILDNIDVDNKIFKMIGGEIFVRKDMNTMFDVLTNRGANIIFGTNSLNPPTVSEQIRILPKALICT